jgi:hypothetical protein
MSLRRTDVNSFPDDIVASRALPGKSKARNEETNIGGPQTVAGSAVLQGPEGGSGYLGDWKRSAAHFWRVIEFLKVGLLQKAKTFGVGPWLRSNRVTRKSSICYLPRQPRLMHHLHHDIDKSACRAYVSPGLPTSADWNSSGLSLGTGWFDIGDRRAALSHEMVNQHRIPLSALVFRNSFSLRKVISQNVGRLFQ